MKNIFVTTLAILIFGILYFLSEDTFSYPRFSAYSGDKCTDCHVSPTGGLMRNFYGINYAKENLQWKFLDKYSNKVNFDPKLNKTISIGGDLRIANVNVPDSVKKTLSSFLPMQGDFYVNVNVSDFVSIFVSQGVDLPTLNTKPEFYGMISKLPANLYFKAGRFTPNYGINIPEHRAYQRFDFLGTPYSADAGFELGMTPGPLTFNVGIFNGVNTDFFDTDRKKMIVANADVMLIAKQDKLNIDIGSSFYNNPFDYRDPLTGNTLNAFTHAFSGFTKIGILNHIVLLGEADFKEDVIEGSMTRGLYGFGELDIKLIKGLELRGQYEYKDPNRDIGNDRAMRYSIGGAIFPLVGVEFEAMLRFVNYDYTNNLTEYQGMLHFYF